MGVGGLFVFEARNWPRCQEDGGLKRLSVGGFSGFILCQGEKRRRYGAGVLKAIRRGES